MESSTSLDFRNILASRGLVGPGADWLLRALHPSGSTPSGCIPDLSRCPSFCMDMRPALVVSPPGNVGSGDLWDCLIWCPPGDSTIAIIVTAPAGVDFNTAVPITPLSLSGTAVVQVLSAQPQGPEHHYASTTLEPYMDGSGNSDFQSSYFPASLPVAFRTAYRSITASLTASALNNQGTVYSTQFARRLTPSGMAFTDHIAGQEGAPQYIAAGWQTYVPFDENTLNMMSPSAETRPARDGVYMPFRLSGPTQDFVQPAMTQLQSYETVGNTGAGAGAYYSSKWLGITQYVAAGGASAQSYYPNIMPGVAVPITDPTAASGQTWPPWYAMFGFRTDNPYISPNNVVGANYTSNNLPFDTGFDNCAQGVTIFRGLSQQATITVQGYLGLEIIPRMDSPFISMVKEPPPPDPRVLPAYYEIVNSMPVSYPSRYNSLGLLLPLLVDALRVVAPHIPSAVSAVVRYLRPGPKPPRLAQAPLAKPTKPSKKPARAGKR